MNILYNYHISNRKGEFILPPQLILYKNFTICMVTKMKKLLSVLLLIIAFSSLSACGKQGNSQPVSDDPTNGINNGLKSNEYSDTVTDL